MRQPLGVWVYISRDCFNIVTGPVYGDSHWAYRVAFIGTVLISPLGITCVYIDFKWIEIATGCRNLPYCYF